MTTVLTWAGLILAAWLFLSFLTATAWHLTRQAVRRRALDALIEATRERIATEVGQPVPCTLAPPWDEWERELTDGSGL